MVTEEVEARWPKGLGLPCHLPAWLPRNLRVFRLWLLNRWHHWFLNGLRVNSLSVLRRLRETEARLVSHIHHPASLPFPASAVSLGAASSLESLCRRLWLASQIPQR